ncbi:hypothetical protein [Iodidimonas nitroreducens]|nr:hypothetical protein [Iodidimonas nitroreducens]
MDKPGLRAEGAVRIAIMALQIAAVIMLAWLFVRLFWALVAPLSISFGPRLGTFAHAGAAAFGPAFKA